MTTPTRIAWQAATVERVSVETPTVKSFAFRLPDWQPFRAGQHFDVRLTAPDGYQAQRSYSAASAPESEGLLELTVEKMPGGEVSPYFHDVVVPGDAVELRGPIGGPFTWSAAAGGPLLLIGGGSGVVPLMSMLRHRRAAGSDTPVALVYSARTWDDVIYRDVLEGIAAVDPAFRLVLTLTGGHPDEWGGHTRRVDAGMIEGAIAVLGRPRYVFCCGSDGFVENAANLVVAAGVAPETVRTERFGPTGP
jgi:ferredoxin-NADP reductase